MNDFQTARIPHLHRLQVNRVVGAHQPRVLATQRKQLLLHARELVAALVLGDANLAGVYGPRGFRVGRWYSGTIDGLKTETEGSTKKSPLH
jgi:hypothetical protein